MMGETNVVTRTSLSAFLSNREEREREGRIENVGTKLRRNIRVN